MRGVPRSGLWSEEGIASSGTGSERAQVASVAEGKPPASRSPRPLDKAVGPTAGLVPRWRSRFRAPLRRGVRTRRMLRLVLPRRPGLGILEEDTHRVEFLPDPVGLGEVLPRAGRIPFPDPPLDFPGGDPLRPGRNVRPCFPLGCGYFAPEVLLRRER